MLEQLLCLVAEGGIHRPSYLATQLGVSPDLVEQMLAELERMGYLDRNGCDESGCGGCGGGCVSSLNRSSPLWVMTSKGFRVVDQTRQGS